MKRRYSTRIGERMLAIQGAVKHYPGMTAHALAVYVYGERRPRWGRVYAAFARAAAAGLIKAEKRGRNVYYFPVETGNPFLDACADICWGAGVCCDPQPDGTYSLRLIPPRKV